MSEDFENRPATPGEHAPPAPPPRFDEQAGRRSNRHWGQLTAGAVLVTVGLLWLLDATELVDLRWRVVLPAALAVVGLATLALSFTRQTGELVGVGWVLTVVVILGALAPTRVAFGVGNQEERPASAAEVEDRYAHGIGDLTVDMRDVVLAEDSSVEASLGIGQLVVRLPEGVRVELDASAGIGQVEAFDRSRGGLGPRLRETFPGEGPTLALELTVGIGQVRVER